MEPIAGAYRIEQTRRGKALISQYAQLLSLFPSLPCDAVTGEICGRLRAALDAAGHRIPLHDAWIAAVARQYSLAVATRDAHFDWVTGISVARW
jgi:predicted nucleic acid-binding protein